MTRDEILSRLIFVKGTPRNEKPEPVSVRKRDDNFVPKEESHPAEDLDFFEYERELAELKPARELALIHPEEVPEEEKVDIGSGNGFIVMYELEVENNEALSDDKKESLDKGSTKEFEFIRCEFVKDDGDRCKKQAKKGNNFCGIHNKYLAKLNKD